MQWNPYLAFDGQCADAFKFYERCLGGKIAIMLSYGDSPHGEHVQPADRSKIMHARLLVGNQILMGADTPPGRPYEGVKGCTVALQIDTPEEADKIFNALAENGTVMMPLEETFWARRFGMLTDQFGVPWMVNCEKKS